MLSFIIPNLGIYAQLKPDASGISLTYSSVDRDSVTS